MGDKGASPTHRKEYSIVARKLLQATNVKRYTQQPRYFHSTKHCACDLRLQEGVGDGKGEDKAKEDRWLCFGKSRSVIWKKRTKVEQEQAPRRHRQKAVPKYLNNCHCT